MDDDASALNLGRSTNKETAVHEALLGSLTPWIDKQGDYEDEAQAQEPETPRVDDQVD